MNDNKLLNQIGNLMDKKLQPLKTDLKEVRKRLGGTEKQLDGVEKGLGGVQKQLGGTQKRIDGVQRQLDTVELKVELVNERVGKAHQELQGSIKQSQEETIDALSALIHTGYNMHEKRIRKIEDHLQRTNPQ